jgi:hypothetical protein
MMLEFKEKALDRTAWKTPAKEVMDPSKCRLIHAEDEIIIVDTKLLFKQLKLNCLS